MGNVILCCNFSHWNLCSKLLLLLLLLCLRQLTLLFNSCKTAWNIRASTKRKAKPLVLLCLWVLGTSSVFPNTRWRAVAKSQELHELHLQGSLQDTLIKMNSNRSESLLNCQFIPTLRFKTNFTRANKSPWNKSFKSVHCVTYITGGTQNKTWVKILNTGLCWSICVHFIQTLQVKHIVWSSSDE